MLANHTPSPTLAVSDLDRAKAFYEGVLGLVPQGDPPEGVMYGAGDATVFVYPSSFAGTNKATALSWMVPSDAFEEEVAALRDKGVAFVTFDAPGMTWDDGVASMGDGAGRGVWFEDPDGNIINIDTGM